MIQDVDVHDSVALVREALAGDQAALSRLVATLTPVMQARVARTLLARRSRLSAHRNVRQEVEDLTQEIFLSLFAKGGRVLRGWDGERGLSLENFVGLVSERHVVSFLRSARRNPWREEPESPGVLDAPTREPGPEEAAVSREQLRFLLDRLRETLSPLGRRLFELLFVQELSVEDAMETSGLSADAVYAWRSRLRRLARHLMAEVSGTEEPARTTRKDGAG